MLKKQHWNINCTDQHGYNILYQYIKQEGQGYDIEFIRALIRLGIDLKYRLPVFETNILNYAARSGVSSEIVELLLQNGADPNNVQHTKRHLVDWNLSYNPLRKTAPKEFARIIKLLFKFGFDSKLLNEKEFCRVYLWIVEAQSEERLLVTFSRQYSRGLHKVPQQLLRHLLSYI